MKVFNNLSKKKVSVFFSLIALILLIGLVVYYIYPYFYFLTNIDETRKFISKYEILAPLVLILLHIVQVLLTPIPGQVVGLVSGYLFGWFLGTIYTMIGVTLGSLLAIFLARKLGRPFVEKLTSKKNLEKFDGIIKNDGMFTIFILFLFPAVPDDTICLLAGLTNIKIKTLVLLAFIGRFPGFLVLNIIGSGIAVYEAYLFLALLIILIISILIFIFRNNLEKIFNRILKINP